LLNQFRPDGWNNVNIVRFGATLWPAVPPAKVACQHWLLGRQMKTFRSAKPEF